MLKDITFGQYYESKSVVHKCDPRVKMLLMIAYIVFVFVAGNKFSLLLSAVTVAVMGQVLIWKLPTSVSESFSR